MASFRNPSPPPGYISSSSVEIVERSDNLSGIHKLIQESGIFDSTDNYDEFIIMTSDVETEVPAIVVKEGPTSPEPVVDLTPSEDRHQKVKIENTSPKLKEKKYKRKKRERSSSCSSGDFRISRHSKVVETKSRSGSEDRSDYDEKNMKMEKNKAEDIETVIITGDMLHRSYYCLICKASMTDYGAYQSHINGKRHLGNIKLRNTAEVVSKSIAPTIVKSRYPSPPPGVYRMKTADVSKIQNIVEETEFPCLGLCKVIEIQGLIKTTYYCELCDTPCPAGNIILHLRGFKHQLQCVRLYEPEVYEIIYCKKRQHILKSIFGILQDAEKRYGRGKIKVEKEYEGTYPSSNTKLNGSYTSRNDMPVPSHMDPEDAFPEHYSLATSPDTSKSDFYCKNAKKAPGEAVFSEHYSFTTIPDFYCTLCDLHMISEQMWGEHIRGKHHLTNAKKAPGEALSKTKSVLLPHARAKIMDNLDQIDVPVVGLGEMRETQNPDAPGEMYNCFLCGACMSTKDVIDHILSLKHRTKYLEKIKHPKILLLKDTNFQETQVSAIIEEICFKAERERGQGYLEVYIMQSDEEDSEKKRLKMFKIDEVDSKEKQVEILKTRFNHNYNNLKKKMLETGEDSKKKQLEILKIRFSRNYKNLKKNLYVIKMVNIDEENSKRNELKRFKKQFSNAKKMFKDILILMEL